MVAGLIVGSVVAKADDNRVMVTGTILSIAGISWLAIAPSFTLALAASFLRGASEVIIGASSYSIVARMAPEEYRGRLFAYYNTTFFLSWGIAATFYAGPIADILIGLGFSNADAYRGSFIAAIAMIAMGVLILLQSFRYIQRSGPSSENQDVE
jgi:MFS family permease